MTERETEMVVFVARADRSNVVRWQLEAFTTKPPARWPDRAPSRVGQRVGVTKAGRTVDLEDEPALPRP